MDRERSQNGASRVATPSKPERPASPYHVRFMRALVFAFIGVGLVTGQRFFFWVAVALAVPTMIAWGRSIAQRLS